VLLDPRPQIRHLADLSVFEAGSLPTIGQLEALRSTAFGRSNGHAFVPKTTLDDLAGEGVHDEVVGVDRTRDHRLA
jgi:hypothetical protein